MPHASAAYALQSSNESRTFAGVDGRAVAELKARDNTTNWRHLAGLWMIIIATIAVAAWAESSIVASGASLWWLAPVFITSAIITGASQHQLGGVIHEGTHFLLFENKRLNELASDWLGAFPIYTSTYQYRVHHLAHHQFVNDPERDPDIAQLKDSDHWLDFPIAHIDVLKKLFRQLWLPNVMRFTFVRARYSALGHEKNPYIEKGAVADKWPVRVGLFFAIVNPFIVSALLGHIGPKAAALMLVGSYVAVIAYYLWLPAERFPQTRLQPVVSHRATAIGRMTFLLILYGAFTVWDSLHGGTTAFDHYGYYWGLPLFTTFPLYMMIRQWVQHGNADRGRYTNTRVFLVNPLVRYAIFPWGMDYHLPHHMMASVPHYKLKALHELMLQDPQYAQKGVVVEGVTGHDDHGHGHPTIFSVLGHKHAPSGDEAIHVDHATLEYAEVKNAAAIARESEHSARAR